jgi:hypothetical protein
MLIYTSEAIFNLPQYFIHPGLCWLSTMLEYKSKNFSDHDKYTL